MNDGPRCKGTAIQGLVLTIQADPDRYGPLLPPKLKHYLTERILVSSWYPTEELIAILRLLGKELQGDFPDQDIYEFFGSISALRDLEGEQSEQPGMENLGVGLYSNLMPRSTQLATTARRSALLWQNYHDTGRMRVARSGQRAVRAELTGFPLPCREICLVNLGYVRQLSDSAGVDATVTMPQCRSRGDDSCVWITQYAPGVDVSDLDHL